MVIFNSFLYVYQRVTSKTQRILKLSPKFPGASQVLSRHTTAENFFPAAKRRESGLKEIPEAQNGRGMIWDKHIYIYTYIYLYSNN